MFLAERRKLERARHLRRPRRRFQRHDGVPSVGPVGVGGPDKGQLPKGVEIGLATYCERLHVHQTSVDMPPGQAAIPDKQPFRTSRRCWDLLLLRRLPCATGPPHGPEVTTRQFQRPFPVSRSRRRKVGKAIPDRGQGRLGSEHSCDASAGAALRHRALVPRSPPLLGHEGAAAGVPESVVMKVSGRRTREVFARYNIVEDEDVRDAVRRLGASLCQGSVKVGNCGN